MNETAQYEHSDKHGRLFVGHQPRECGEHRTVGSYRAWCYDCAEWCYPSNGCVRCEIMELRALQRADLREQIAQALTAHVVRGYACTCGADINDAARHCTDAVMDALREAGVTSLD